jgi:hypothetical protein
VAIHGHTVGSGLTLSLAYWMQNTCARPLPFTGGRLSSFFGQRPGTLLPHGQFDRRCRTTGISNDRFLRRCLYYGSLEEHCWPSLKKTCPLRQAASFCELATKGFVNCRPRSYASNDFGFLGKEKWVFTPGSIFCKIISGISCPCEQTRKSQLC